MIQLLARARPLQDQGSRRISTVGGHGKLDLGADRLGTSPCVVKLLDGGIIFAVTQGTQ